MSSELAGLLSVTFAEPHYDHIIELVHQRGVAAHRRLESLGLTVYDGDGRERLATAVDPDREILDLGALLDAVDGWTGRLMVVFDARYNEHVFPYRPHHYAYLHRRGSPAPSLYYAVNAALGGVPDRIGATNINNFETYLFRRGPFAERYAVILGNVSRWATAQAQVITYYGPERATHVVELPPKTHVEVELEASRHAVPLERVETKSPFRLASYVAARKSTTGELVLFDHLFTYVK